MKRLLLLLILALPLVAQTQYTITPSRGPVTGGTQVTIKGSFGEWPYGVIFGDTSVPATRVDATTLTATTPAHLPGEVNVTIFEYDIGLLTGLKFTFEGEPEDAFERLLLPVFTEPIAGAFGSEFRTELTMRLAGASSATIEGFYFHCPVLCIENGRRPVTLTTTQPDLPGNIAYAGAPGAFLYVPKGDAEHLAANLRVLDTSRSAENFGTEIPIVRERELTEGWDDSITLLGIPSDPRFRNTLRIYSDSQFAVDAVVDIEGAGVSSSQRVTLRPGTNLFEPGYAQFSNFPTGVGPLRVTIRLITLPITMPPPPRLWAFVSVTNNVTQHITTITPQP
jgi:hypothetical protein